jgi:copper chaperone CopZ
MSSAATAACFVPEVSWGRCKSTIEAAIQGLGDVESVDVDINAKTVTVRVGRNGAIIAVIEDAGDDVVR